MKNKPRYNPPFDHISWCYGSQSSSVRNLYAVIGKVKWDKRLSSFIQTQRVNLMRLDVLNTFLFSSENLAGQLKNLFRQR